MPAHESTAKNFLVTALVAVFCSLGVSATAVGLRKGDGTPVDDFGHESLEQGLIDAMIA